MPTAANGEVEIYYEVYGSPADPVLIMIEGFTVQLIAWRPELIEMIVDQGVRVVLLDNRDVGLSSKLPGNEYTVVDMAKDVIAVADDLGVASFHIAGQSMGGMIAQQAIASYPDRILSATLIYTAPQVARKWSRDPDAEQVGLEVARNREEAVETSVARERVSSSPGYEFDEEWVRYLAGAQYDRCYDPSGYERQQAAMASFDEGALPSIAGSMIPSAVIHGTDDAYFLPRGAEELHHMLPNSELHLYPGMGHELVRPLLPEYARTIARTVKRAEKASETD